MLHTTIVLITKNQSTFYHGFLIIHYINNSNFKLNLVQHTKTKMLKLQIKKNLNNIKKLLIFLKHIFGSWKTTSLGQENSNQVWFYTSDTINL